MTVVAINGKDMLPGLQARNNKGGRTWQARPLQARSAGSLTSMDSSPAAAMRAAPPFSSSARAARLGMTQRLPCVQAPCVIGHTPASVRHISCVPSRKVCQSMGSAAIWP